MSTTMSNKENGSTPGSGGGNSSSGQPSGASSEAHQYVGPYRLEKTLGKGQTGKICSSQLNVQKVLHFVRFNVLLNYKS